MVTIRSGRLRDLRQRFIGRDEAKVAPELAAQSDHDIAVLAESRRRSWMVNTMILKTIRDRLRDGEAHS